MLFSLAASIAVAGTGADRQSSRASEPAGIAQRSQDALKQKLVTATGSLAKDAWKHFGPYELPSGQSLTAKLSGTGDADLYVRKGSPPNPAAFDCRPHTPTSNEVCTVSGAGKVYVSVNGFAASSTFSLEIKYPVPRSNPVIPAAPRPSP